MLHLWMPVGSGLCVRGSLAYRGYVPIKVAESSRFVPDNRGIAATLTI
jgi:hypothetical protein